MVRPAFNPSNWEAQAGRSVSLRPSCSSQQIRRLPELFSETLSQTKTKQTKEPTQQQMPIIPTQGKWDPVSKKKKEKENGSLKYKHSWLVFTRFCFFRQVSFFCWPQTHSNPTSQSPQCLTLQKVFTSPPPVCVCVAGCPTACVCKVRSHIVQNGMNLLSSRGWPRTNSPASASWVLGSQQWATTLYAKRRIKLRSWACWESALETELHYSLFVSLLKLNFLHWWLKEFQFLYTNNMGIRHENK